jgi:hypothetical protein
MSKMPHRPYYAVFGPDGKILTDQPAMSEMLGWRAGHLASGRQAQLVVSPPGELFVHIPEQRPFFISGVFIADQIKVDGSRVLMVGVSTDDYPLELLDPLSIVIDEDGDRIYGPRSYTDMLDAEQAEWMSTYPDWDPEFCRCRVLCPKCNEEEPCGRPIAGSVGPSADSAGNWDFACRPHLLTMGLSEAWGQPLSKRMLERGDWVPIDLPKGAPIKTVGAINRADRRASKKRPFPIPTK